MYTFYLTRHGETYFNVIKKMQGWCDSPLTEKGILQAKALARGFEDIPFISAHSSSSERAMDTAAYILEGRKDISYSYLKGLKEVHFGSFEGELQEKAFANEAYWMEHGWTEVGGETLPDACGRFLKTLEEIASQEKEMEGNILIVSHGAIIISVIQKFRPDYVKRVGIRGLHNCSVTRLSYEKGRFELLDFDETAYLEKGMRL